MDIARPVFLSGKVLVSDGTVPPEPATIEMLCNGVPRPQGYTNSRGHFSFQVGQNQGVMADATYSGASDAFGMPGVSSRGNAASGGLSAPTATGLQLRERDLAGCELRAVIPGFRSESIILANRRLMDNPDVGTILIHRLENVSGFTYSLTSANAPKDARKAYEKGLDLIKKKKVAEAEEQFTKATAGYDKYAVAWYELGRVQLQQNKAEEARKSFDAAIAADGKYVLPNMQIALMAFNAGKWDEAATFGDRVTKLDPYSYPQAYLVTSIAYLQMSRYDEAEKNGRELMKLDPNNRFPKGKHVMGVILANKHQYPEALQFMRDYLRIVPDGRDAESVKSTIAKIEQMVGPNAAATPKPPQQD